MKKSNKSWIIAGLLTLATFLATIYSIVAYHDSVMIVGIMCLLFLGSAFWLFLCINNMLESRNSHEDRSVGEEQRERMNYEGMKLQGEEMLRLMNSLGKGTYVNAKRSAEHLNTLLEQYSESRATTEKLLQTLIEEQTKTAKMQIKYNQNDTGKMIAALNEQCARLDTDFDRCITAIQTQASNSGSSQNNDIVSESLHTLTVELAHINSSIQALQIQLNSIPQQPAIAYAAPMPQMAMPAQQAYPAPITEPSPAEPTVSPEPAVVAEEMPAPAEPEPTPIVEEASAPEPEPTPIVDEAPAPEPEPTPIVDEAPAPEPEPTPAPAPDMGTGKMDQAMIDALLAGSAPATAEAPAPEPEPEPTSAPAPAPDMGTGKMDQAMIDALLAGSAPAAAEAPAPEPEPEPTPAPAPDMGTGKMDQAMIDALLAGTMPAAEAAPAPVTEVPAEPTAAEEPEPVVETASLMSGDPNKQLSADEIAALFAAIG